MLLRKTEFHFSRTKAFIRFCINLKNLLLKLLIFLFSVRRLTVNVLVVKCYNKVVTEVANKI